MTEPSIPDPTPTPTLPSVEEEGVSAFNKTFVENPTPTETPREQGEVSANKYAKKLKLGAKVAKLIKLKGTHPDTLRPECIEALDLYMKESVDSDSDVDSYRFIHFKNYNVIVI